ncbi:MAG TPA: hypothetical protein PLY87_30880, partial [Planctomycetaceae bacterium]|nr:hypothetical protein [Planctomycetaceae bacterium]
MLSSKTMRILAGLSLALSTVLLSSLTVAKAAESSTVELTREGSARLPIIISDKASVEVRKSADELAEYLGKMSGGKFVIEIGNGSRGLVVGQPTDFASLPFELAFESGPFHREDYVLRSHPNGLYLLGASDLAVSHAIWDLLYRLGYRQFFPGPTWEVIPEARD